MTSYVDYTYYTGTYKGTKIPSTSFDKFGLRASYVIKNVLMGKDYTDYNDTDYTTDVKMATCSIADILYDEETYADNTSNGSITSEKIGDYSKSFGNQETVSKETDKKVKKELFMYLGMTGLLNRSINCVYTRY